MRLLTGAWCALMLSGSLALPGAGHAAEVRHLPSGSSLRFRHITLEDGLAQSSVQAVAQDRQGYMWFGTEDGLQRYDGYEFLTFHHDPEKPDSLADDDINALAVGPRDALWIGTTEHGVDLLEPGSKRFVHYQHDPADASSLVDNHVFALMMDKRGTLWVGTPKGLDRMDGATGHFHHYGTSGPNNHPQIIFSLYQDERGRIWVGTRTGLYFYDGRDDKLTPFVPKSGVSLEQAKVMLTQHSINAFGAGTNGDIWVATERGLVSLSTQGVVMAVYQHDDKDSNSLISNRARALAVDSSGDVWIGTADQGISRLDHTSKRFFSYQHDAVDPQSLSGDSILTLFKDQSGLIWIGTQAAGISIYNPQTREFGYYRHRQGDPNSLASNMVWDMYKDARGDIWVATQKGLTRIAPKAGTYRQYQMGNRPKDRLDDAAVFVIAGDSEGDLWAGTDYGLFRYDRARDGFRQIRLAVGKDKQDRNVISSVFEDHSHRLWVGTVGGLALFDPRTNKVKQWFVHDPKRPDSLPDNSISAICQTQDGALWLGTISGLAKFDGQHDHFSTYTKIANNAHSLSSNNIQSCAAAGNNLWVGSVSGLDFLNTQTGQVRRYSTSDGLPNDSIYAILRDNQGDIWVSTDNGLSRLDPRTGDFRNYGPTDGLQSPEFNGSSAFKAADGELFFGGINGFNAFYPSQIHRNQHNPKVAITEFTHAGHQTPLLTKSGRTESVVLPYTDNILSFTLAVFDYAAPARNQFMYRLDDFDTEWHKLKGQHAFTYTNLDPGSYLLRVKGSNSDGVWSNNEATLKITVLPPPWRTWWAYSLYASLLFVLIVMGLKLFARWVKREQALLNEHQKRMWAETLHNLIQSVMTVREERAISEQLIDVLVSFAEYDVAMFFMEDNDEFKLIASRGIEPSEHARLERWPVEHARVMLTLRQTRIPRLLSNDEAQTLGTFGNGQMNFLAVPLASASSNFRLLLVGREMPAIDRQSVDIAAAMAKQVSVALDNAHLIHELENLATTDSLTRLHNRRYFLERAEAEFERSRRYDRPLSIFLLDADNFKAINDNYGHETGDQVLRALAAVCRHNLRQLDVIGRYGGEEFVVLLPETSLPKALEVAERLRAGVAEHKVESAVGEIGMSVSIGVALATSQTDSIAALINEADRALYKAKRAGRNKVVLSGDDQPNES